MNDDTDIETVDQSPAPETVPVAVDTDTDTDTDTDMDMAADLPASGDGTSEATDDVALVRDFIVATDGALVAELVGGRTVGDVLASVETARAAYRRIAERVHVGQPVPAAAPPAASSTMATAAPVPFVPAGGMTPFAIDPATLPSSELIRRGLEHSRHTSGG